MKCLCGCGQEVNKGRRYINGGHSMRGKTPWNKGKTGIYTEATLEKISEGGKGRVPWNKEKKGVYSKDSLKKMSKNHKGKTPWNKGMKGRQSWHNTKGLIKAKEGNTQGFQKGNIPKTAWKKGHVSWNYIDGRSKLVGPGRYGDDWFKIRLLVYKRDNYTCQECGITMSENKKPHHIHHKIPFLVSFDNSLSNLITLCPSCHRKIETKIMKELKRKAMAEEIKQ